MTQPPNVADYIHRSQERNLSKLRDMQRSQFTSTEVVYGVTGTGVTELPEYGVSP
jgi:hypothetical protein